MFFLNSLTNDLGFLSLLPSYLLNAWYQVTNIPTGFSQAVVHSPASFQVAARFVACQVEDLILNSDINCA